MKLQKQPPIEMAPGCEWDSYRSEHATIAFPADSDILDRATRLRDVLAGGTGSFADMCDEYIGHGSEADVYGVRGCETELAVKVTPVGSSDGLASRALRMARYGGVCVERAMKGAVVGDYAVATPGYHAVVSTNSWSAVVMSREPKKPLSDFMDNGQHADWDVSRKARLASELITQATQQALQQMGLTSEVAKIMDINPSNLLARHDEQGIDWSELTIVDAMFTYAVHPPKLWENTSRAYTEQ